MDAARLLLKDRGFGALRRIGLGFQPTDKGPESKCVTRVGLPSEFGNAVEIGQSPRATIVKGNRGEQVLQTVVWPGSRKHPAGIQPFRAGSSEEPMEVTYRRGTFAPQ
jgi:hypothetical protein